MHMTKASNLWVFNKELKNSDNITGSKCRGLGFISVISDPLFSSPNDNEISEEAILLHNHVHL